MRYRYLYYLLLLIPAFIFRDFTPANELKYISIADEALQSGTWFTFYNHGEIYADKPPLFFWLIMLSKLITGGYHMWLIGLFS
ncbi:MAG: glycosyl transferase, partial [Candidatus Cloacimonetes bacterium]|nr:glycosyl transferase [Candidatus Cloacimonadota bacterium]